MFYSSSDNKNKFDDYIEYIAYGVDSKKFYLLDPDMEIINSFDTLSELGEECGIEIDTTELKKNNFDFEV